MLLTLSEVSEKLRVSDKTITREIKAGRFQATKVGKGWRFTEDMVQDYLQSKLTIKKIKKS